jgi:hypothetical protein
MSTSIPLNFRASPLPSGAKYTPQQLLDAIVARLVAESTNSISFFASGSVAPSSNVGPWLKDGTTWYVWDNGTAAYVPLVMAAASLKYVASQTTPDPALYTFWIKLGTTGQAESIQFYFDGAWHDIYEAKFASYSTTAQMTTAINTAITAALVSKAPAKAKNATTQTIATDSTEYQVLAASKDFDPDNVYDTTTSAYLVPTTGYYFVSANMQIDNAAVGGSDIADTEFGLVIRPNGIGTNDAAAANGYSVASPPGDRWYPSVCGVVHLEAGFSVRMFLTGTSGTPGNVDISNVEFCIYRVQ